MGTIKIIAIIVMLVLMFSLGVMFGSAAISLPLAENPEKARRIASRMHNVSLTVAFIMLVTLLVLVNINVL